MLTSARKTTLLTKLSQLLQSVHRTTICGTGKLLFFCVFFFHFIFFLSNIRVTTPPPALPLASYLVQSGFLLRTSVLPDATLLCPCRVQPAGFIAGMQHPDPLRDRGCPLRQGICTDTKPRWRVQEYSVKCAKKNRINMC